MLPFDKMPYTNFHELNLAYFIVHFREIFAEWETLYNNMVSWREQTDADLTLWKTDTLNAIEDYERDLTDAWDAWKAETALDIADWKDETLEALDAWKTAFQTLFDSTFSNLTQIKTDAESARDAAIAAQNRAEVAAASLESALNSVALFDSLLTAQELTVTIDTAGYKEFEFPIAAGRVYRLTNNTTGSLNLYYKDNDSVWIQIRLSIDPSTSYDFSLAQVSANTLRIYVSTTGTVVIQSVDGGLYSQVNAGANAAATIAKQTFTVTKSDSSGYSYITAHLYEGRTYRYTNNTSGSVSLRVYDADGNITQISASIHSGGYKDFTPVVDYVRVGGYFSTAGDCTLESVDTGIFDLLNGYNTRISANESAIAVLQAPQASITMFETMGAIGDSYSVGAVYGVSGASGVHPNFAWAAQIGRRNGIDAEIFAASGSDVSAWLASSAFGLGKLTASTKKQLYVIMLGINTEKLISDPDTNAPTGTTADINLVDPEQNADTFCGHYGKMLSAILQYTPNSKIILVVPPATTGGQSTTERALAIPSIAELFSLPYFNLGAMPFLNSQFYRSHISTGHPTAVTYSGLALSMQEGITQTMVDFETYFHDYTGNV